MALAWARKSFMFSNFHEMLSATEKVVDLQDFRLQRSWVIESNELRLRFVVSKESLQKLALLKAYLVDTTRNNQLALVDEPSNGNRDIDHSSGIALRSSGSGMGF